MNLTDAGTLRDFLAGHGVSANKGLGQHFLCSRPAVSKIVASLAECRGVLEIGPGPGVLTGPLSETAEKVVAIELDERMIVALSESAPRADVRHLDALKASLSDLLLELPEPRGVVSNLPYYITGPLLTRIAEARAHFSKAVLMMQKEVAQRVVAGPKTPMRGSLSVFLQLQFQISRVCEVPAGSFMPPPKVDSTVLAFTPTVPLLHDSIAESSLFRLVRFGFAQPRKTLINNLIAGYHFSRDRSVEVIAQAGLGEKARPQELDLPEWLRLAQVLRT